MITELTDCTFNFIGYVQKLSRHSDPGARPKQLKSGGDVARTEGPPPAKDEGVNEVCLNVSIPNSHSASISFTFYLLCVIKSSVVTTNIEEIKRDYPGPSTMDPPLHICFSGGGGTNELCESYAIYKNFVKVKNLGFYLYEASLSCSSRNRNQQLEQLKAC